MKLFQIMALAVILAGAAWAEDVPAAAVPEIDGTAVIGGLGLLAGGLLIVRARRNRK